MKKNSMIVQLVFLVGTLGMSVPLASAVEPPPPLSQTNGLQRDVSELLKPIIEKHKIPGIAAVIVSGDRIEAIGCAGIRKKGSPEAVTNKDLWHLGSCTKSMTATMVALLVEEGKLSWNTTLAEAFPDLRDQMKPAWHTATLDQLLSNRSGAPGGLDADGLWGRLWQQNGSLTDQRMELLKGVILHDPAAPPGSKNIYSNGGFSMAGAIAEKVTRKSYEDLMRERLFVPLGMTSAGFGAPGTPGSVDQPRGHGGNGEACEPTVGKGVGNDGCDNPPAISPAGRVHCTIEHWGKYIALHLRGDKENPSRKCNLLKAESFDKLHEARTVKAEDGKETATGYACGWGRPSRPWAGGDVLTHNGSNTMWFCVTWIAPKKDFAVLVCCNQGGDAAAKACDDAASAMIQDHLSHAKSDSRKSEPAK
jgi:CubicO group peptidase (beta-lactamase class C family)